MGTSHLLRGAVKVVAWLYRTLWKKPKDAKGPVRTTALWLCGSAGVAVLLQALVSGDEVGRTVANALGTVLGYVLGVCFLVGLAFRFGLSLHRAAHGHDTRSRQRAHGRTWPDERRRRRSNGRIRNDDPEFPLRGRRQ